ncbi:hypothetical protein CALVIDRAFT_374740 [Calocera viscosa TUFC12733]|uniref:Uncharacterized protein n=1 Tax=Calocera viscosa (strain TUFC12733) TaxID=1330018 RepID=A0A167GPK1_CALVF|nr:hypothetical protein CALVIDRAFT_374740 [Calocera viscosa TUFC12733]
MAGGRWKPVAGGRTRSTGNAYSASVACLGKQDTDSNARTCSVSFHGRDMKIRQGGARA